MPKNLMCVYLLQAGLTSINTNHINNTKKYPQTKLNKFRHLKVEITTWSTLFQQNPFNVMQLQDIFFLSEAFRFVPDEQREKYEVYSYVGSENPGMWKI